MKLVWNICDICLLYLYCLISISGIINVDWTWHTFTVFNGLHTYDAPYRVPQECQIGYSQVVYRCTVRFADSRKNWRANMSHSQYSGINTAIQKIYWLTTYAAKISIKLNGIFNHVQPEDSQDCQRPQRLNIRLSQKKKVLPNSFTVTPKSLYVLANIYLLFTIFIYSLWIHLFWGSMRWKQIEQIKLYILDRKSVV